MSYADDRQWSDAYLPTVRRIVGPLLLAPAPLEQDRSEATDLIVLRARDMRIGVRVRRPGFASAYPSQFTIRSGRSTGVPTELDKILDGWGDWLFYGHACGPTGIDPWLIIDLDKLRRAFIDCPSLLHQPDGAISGRKPNRDGTSFTWFNADRLPRDCLVARATPAWHDGPRHIGEILEPVVVRASAAWLDR